MRAISVQQMPNGFEIETPTFWYWMKAGMAFTLGGSIVVIVSVLCWTIASFGALAAIASNILH